VVAVQSRREDGAVPPTTGRGRALPARRALPGGRAVVGGLLVALSAVVLFAVASGVGDGSGREYVVARRDLAPGRPIDPGDLELAEIDLPDRVGGQAFGSVDALDGAVAVAPIAAGELVQQGSVARGGADGRVVPELSFAVEREAAVDGDLRAGDRVDVLATYGSGAQSRTVRVAGSATVLTVGERDDLAVSEGGGLVLTVAVADAGERLNLVNAVAEAKIRVLRVTGTDPAAGEPSRSDEVPGLVGDVRDDPGETGGEGP
jgi:Flp pilus assembly protein CpaB